MKLNIKAIHHIELTVLNLAQSKEFYNKLLGFKIVAEYPNFVMFCIEDFYLGLTDHKRQIKEKKFNEFNVGIDHVSFEVNSKEDLTKAIIWFDQNNIVHGEIKKLSNNLYVLAFRDPDNIQLELAYKEK